MGIDSYPYQKPAQFDLLIKLCESRLSDGFYPHQLQQMALFAENAEKRLQLGELEGYLHPNLIKKLVEDRIVHLGLVGVGKERFSEIIDEKLLKNRSQILTGHLFSEWEESKAEFEKHTKRFIRKVGATSEDRERLFSDAYERVIKHWHVLCSGAEEVLEALAQKYPGNAIELRTIYKELNGFQKQREAARQQIAFLSPAQMFEIAGVDPSSPDPNKHALHSFVEDRIGHLY